MTEKTPAGVLGMVLKGYPRISETFISNEIRLLERLGFSIRIISMRAPREKFRHASVDEITAPVDYLPSEISGNWGRILRANWRALRLHSRRYRSALAKTLARFARTRRLATIRHFLQAGVVAGEMLPGSGVTHLHAHFAHSPASVASLAARIANIGFSFTGHAKDIWTQRPESLQEKIDQAAFVVTCTGHNRDYLASLNNTGRPLHTVYHGIDLDLFSPRPKQRDPGAPHRILTIARFAPKKGLPTVFRALKRLADDGVSFDYCLIGDGEERERILSELQTLGLAERTQWLGTQAHDEVLRQFERADVFALGCEIARNGDRDGIPNVLAESMAMGVPVVATRVSGIPELVVDGETGLLVEPGDVKAMAEAIRTILEDRSLAERFSQAGRARVTEIFDASRCILDLVEVYRANDLGPSE